MAGLVTVFGGDGFIGRHVTQTLLKAGWRVRIANRSSKRGWFLKSQANLGQIGWVSADITHPETLGRAVDGADAVINLVGSFDDMESVQAQGAANVAQAASAAGTRTLIHVSAIGADPESPSRYGRSKAEGEAAVRAAFPSAVILRPSIVFGREDQFINRFAGLIGMLPVVPIIGGGTKFQPVYAGDVARAIVAALDPRHTGKTFALGGPDVLTMAEINRWIADKTGRAPLFVDVPDIAAGALATCTGWLPGAPITRDQWLMLQRDNVVGEGETGLAALGVSPTPLDAVAEGWLVIYRRNGRFGEKKAA